MSSLGDNDRPPALGRPAWIFWGIVLVVVVALFAARPSLAWWARHSAADHLQAGRISQAEQWLGRATRLDSNSAATQVLIARSYRHPLPADIEAVIRDGIPGTAMPAFAELSDNEREELTAQVYQLRREGMRSQLMEQFRNVGEPIDEQTADELVRQRFAEARPVEVPRAKDLSSDSRRAEGQQLYDQAGCVQCHGPDGRGIFDVPLFNEDGSHAIPRDLALEPWKGGESPEALFARIRIGMPGTPHPENPTLDDEQIISLVAYCLSISNETKVTRTNRERSILANQRAIQARFGAEQ